MQHAAPFTKRANSQWDEDHIGVKEGADDVDITIGEGINHSGLLEFGFLFLVQVLVCGIGIGRIRRHSR
jgi:hypothetical protein